MGQLIALIALIESEGLDWLLRTDKEFGYFANIHPRGEEVSHTNRSIAYAPTMEEALRQAYVGRKTSSICIVK